MADFSDRVRFNWGFHDGTWDAERGKPRRVVPFGEQSPDQVSMQWDRFYADGYAAGLESFADLGRRDRSSEGAWIARSRYYLASGVAFTTTD